VIPADLSIALPGVFSLLVSSSIMTNDFQQAGINLGGERRRKRIITDARREQNRSASRAYRKFPLDYRSRCISGGCYYL
jgi:hypothetical protein